MATEWFYTTNKQEMGPVAWQELRHLAAVGILRPHDLVWSEGMDNWVKAIQQDGLFVKEASGEFASSKSSLTGPKPPPPRRTRKRSDDDEGNDERDENRKARKKKHQRTQMSVGLKVGLILGGVFVLLLGLGCGLGTLIWVSVRNPVRNAANAPRSQAYAFVNLNPGNQNERAFTFQRGTQVSVLATSLVNHPATDVDLFVLRGNAGENLMAADLSLGPNSRVTFIAPATDTYRIRVLNRGPGMANTTSVVVTEQ